MLAIDITFAVGIDNAGGNNGLFANPEAKDLHKGDGQ